MHEFMFDQFTLEEVDDGFKIHIKGDKEKLRPKLEAMEAYMIFQKKAKAAGWPGHGPMRYKHHGHSGWHHKHGMSGMMHSLQAQGMHAQNKFKQFIDAFHKAMESTTSEKKE